VPAVDTATEYGAYLTVDGNVLKSETATAVVHVIDLAPSVPSVVRYNAPVTLAGHLLQDGSQGLASQRVSVMFRPRAGAAWTRTQWVTTNAAGVARLAGRFTRTFQVGIQFPGAGALAPSPLAVKTVRVVPRPLTARNGFRFPFLDPGMVTSPGSWSLDQGVDIFAAGQACGAAAKLVAVGDGTVIQTGISGFGPTAPVIRMSSGPFAGRNVYYGHTGRIYVHVGQQVHAGDVVAQIGCGSVGYSSAPHLEIGVGEPGGPPCCPAFGATARAMYRQLVAALYRR
jgi:murein DD-endopeptidase MepM/ murein hydrolase activator NlpD